MRLFLPSLLLASILAQPVLAQQAVYYRISSGTGFIVNNQGNLVTNAHVVKGCRSISILTAKGELEAVLVASDPDQDLAVLKTAYNSPYIAPLRWNITDLKAGDEVVVMGYPGEQGATGRYQFKKTTVLDLKGPEGKEKWLQLGPVAAQGNSGGPVLDTSGNVIGVVAGMALTYKVDENNQPKGAPIGKVDVAITLVALQEFLHDNAIDFYESTSRGRGYGDGALRNNAHNFIVPVRCIQDIEKR